MDPAAESGLVAALRSGDEAAFRSIVTALHPAMVRVARLHVGSDAVADEVAQEAWVGVLEGLAGFEGRSSLRTWILRITENTAMRRGVREKRSVPLSGLMERALGDDDAAVDPGAFLPPGSTWEGHWAVAPSRWAPEAESALLAGEQADVIRRALDEVPPAQRIVMTLRDVDGWSAAEVCAALEISPGNQRVLLHRARTRVRTALAAYLAGPDPVTFQPEPGTMEA